MALPGARAAAALEALKAAAGPESAASSTARRRSWPPRPCRRGDEIADEEDFAAAACASFIVLLGAHARGLDGYWRTPGGPAHARGPRGLRDRGRRAGARPAAPRPRQGHQARARARAARGLPDVPRLRCSRAPTPSRALDGEPFDVLVIGGGITGAGVALDAATRGYSVALVERGRLRDRHLVALEQARPRRPALPAELRPRAGARGAAGAPDQRRAGAAPGAPAAADRARLRRRPPGPADRARAEHVRRDGGRPDLAARAAGATATATGWRTGAPPGTA